MPHILAIDPGINATGYAFLETAIVPIVHDMGLIRPKRRRADLDLEATIDIAYEIGHKILHNPPTDLVVVEWPRVRRNAPENPQDLLPLTAINGACLLAARLERPTIRMATLSADVWTRGKKKELRQAAFLARLGRENPTALKRVEEVLPKSLRHNAIDALHIAYEAMERKM